MNQILWQPNSNQIESSTLFHFIKYLRDEFDLTFNNNIELHKWSVKNLEQFWQTFLNYSRIIFHGNFENVLSSHTMPFAKWFEGMKLNYAENIFDNGYEGTAIKYFTSVNNSVELIKEYSFDELKHLVFCAAAALKKLGVVKGDRVAGIVTNSPEAVIAALACTVIGAVWSSASPDFGSDALIERFLQIQPKVVFANSSYVYNGKKFEVASSINKLTDKIKSVQSVINVPFNGSYENEITGINWDDFIKSGNNNSITYEHVDFDHPLFVMFSSGTTGAPKCIVHGSGGTLLQHKKEHMLHCDIKTNDSLLYYTTASWMMWNWQLSALSSGAQIVLYDESPAHPNIFSIWDTVEKHNITHFGTSGRYIESCMKHSPQPEPYSTGKFDRLRSIMYTGSPLSSAGYEWIYNTIKKDVRLSGISGGTDIISCFVLGNPMLFVKAGKIQCKGLGVDIVAFDDDGNEILNRPGELVCRKPIPSMPISFLNDPDNKKYITSYFSSFEGVWTHGDYIEFDEEGHSVIYGRSDATLNPGGVRIGVAEIYSALDHIDFVTGAIAVGWIPPGQSDEAIVLLVVLKDNQKLNDEITKQIKDIIKAKNTPRHVPKYIFQISSVPVTRSGKPVEITIKAILSGKEIKNLGSIANVEVLEEVEDIRNKLIKLNQLE